MSTEENDISKYDSMICQSRDVIFYATFDVKKMVREIDLLRVFILISKYYPSYYFEEEANLFEKKRWEEYVLENFEYMRRGNHNFISFSINVNIQDDDGSIFLRKTWYEAIKIYYGKNNGTPFFSIGFFPYVYFNKNVVYTRPYWTGPPVKEIVDQTIAAKKNRELMTNFLKELEQVIGAEINNFYEGEGFSKEHIFKYGFKENAILDVAIEK